MKGAKPTQGAFTTPSYGMSSVKPNEPIGSAGVINQPESFDAFGYQKAMNDYEFRQQAIKNMQDNFPIDHSDGPEGNTQTYGNVPGALETSLQPGPAAEQLAQVDYSLLGADPNILRKNWWSKMYG